MKKLMTIVLLPLFITCNPNENDLVVIGKYTDNLHVVKIEPNIVLQSPEGKDSLDLNADNNFDIVFIKSQTPMMTGYTYATFLHILSDVQIALSEINNYPDSLNVGTQINDNLIWSQPSSDAIVLASYANRSFSNPIGNYHDAIGKYLGFKFGKRFGWIKLDNTVGGELVVKEYVISK